MKTENIFQEVFIISFGIIIASFAIAWVVTEVYFHYEKKRIDKL
jgi:hypothetical protein